MADAKLTKAELVIITEALTVYGGEIGKVMKKAEKLNLKQAEPLKTQYLDVVALRTRIANSID